MVEQTNSGCTNAATGSACKVRVGWVSCPHCVSAVRVLFWRGYGLPRAGYMHPLISVRSISLKLIWHHVILIHSCSYLILIYSSSVLPGCGELQWAGHMKPGVEDGARSGIRDTAHDRPSQTIFLLAWFLDWLSLPCGGFLCEELNPAIRCAVGIDCERIQVVWCGAGT